MGDRTLLDAEYGTCRQEEKKPQRKFMDVGREDKQMVGVTE